ncbi:MAG: EamA family transporter [Thermoleophilia bacterium]
MTLLMSLIRRGAIARVTSVFYLVPPVTAVYAWLWFDETLGPLALAGIGLAALGVAAVQRGARSA